MKRNVMESRGCYQIDHWRVPSNAMEFMSWLLGRIASLVPVEHQHNATLEFVVRDGEPHVRISYERTETSEEAGIRTYNEHLRREELREVLTRHIQYLNQPEPSPIVWCDTCDNPRSTCTCPKP